MANPKTSSHEGQSRNSQEVPIDDKFDTVGTLYSPFREEYNEQTGNRRFTENTLHDIIRDELLSRAVIWLLGYDARYSIDKQFNDKQLNQAPIRAQAGGSHWETAWCIIHFLDARSILSEKYPSIVREINRRLCSDDPKVNPLAWLCVAAINRGEGQAYWQGKEYDTAVVTLALLRARAELDLKIPDRLKVELDEVLPKALRWLYAHLEYALVNIDVDEEAVIVLEPLLYADEHFAPLLSKSWSGSYAAKHKELYDALDKWLSHLEARLSKDKKDVLTHSVFSVDEASCLCRLLFIWRNANLRTQKHVQFFIERAEKLLLHYIEFLEESLAEDQWGIIISKVWKLSVYMEACTITGKLSESMSKEPHSKGMRQIFGQIFQTQSQTRLGIANMSIASAEVTLKVLSIVKNHFFINGSIYHSIYATTYFLRSLIAIWNWSDAKKTIAELYHDLLDKTVTRLSVERQEIFTLNRKLVELEHNLANEKQRYSHLMDHHRWIRRGFIAVLALFAFAFLVSWAMPFLHFGHLHLLDLRIDPGSGEGFLTLIVTCAGLAGSVGYVIDRLWSRLEQ